MLVLAVGAVVREVLAVLAVGVVLAVGAAAVLGRMCSAAYLAV
jgi:hypothetical protein